MKKYLFFLGHQPHISTAEIEAVFGLHRGETTPPNAGSLTEKIKYDVEFLDKNNLILKTTQEIDPQQLIMRLGGTVKIAEYLGDKNQIQKKIIEHLQKAQPDGKLVFSLEGENAKHIALSIKKELKSSGRNARYVEVKNTASILHNNLVEKQGGIIIFQNNIYITKAIQPLEDFASRDFERPGTDSRSGMLPPKLSRIMINLAQADKKSTILDAFCGSGTILMEAALLGYKHIIGGDISQKALIDSDKNLNWLKEKNHLIDLDFELFLADAGEIDKAVKQNSIGAIISEPYMGEPLHGNESEKFLRHQAEQLGDLYTSAFTAFHKIIKKDGTVIFIIPSFAHNNDWVKIDCVEKIKKLGFEIAPFPDNQLFLRYHRPGQKLARDIWRFKKS